MKVKVEKINVLKKSKSAVKAFCSVSVGGVLTINGVKVIENKEGVFASLPTRPYEVDGETKYANIVYVTDEDLYEKIQDVVIAKYEKEVE